MKAVSAVESYDYLTSDDSPPVMTRVSSFPRRLQGSDIVKIRVAREDKPVSCLLFDRVFGLWFFKINSMEQDN